MNATARHLSINAQDYQETMQAVAVNYLRRHWAEHLDDGQLCERACRHLVIGNCVPVFMAQRLVELAMSTLTPLQAIVGVDWGSHGDQTVMVVVQRDPDGVFNVLSRNDLPPPTQPLT